MPHNVYDTSGHKVGEIHSAGEEAVGLGIATVLMLMIAIPLVIGLVFVLPFYAIVNPTANPFELEEESAILVYGGLAVFGFLGVAGAIILVGLMYALATGRKMLSGEPARFGPAVIVGTLLASSWGIASAFLYVRTFLEWLGKRP